MSNKIKSPNQKSGHFGWVIGVIVLIVAIVGGVVVFNLKKDAAKTDAQANMESVTASLTQDGSSVVLKASSATDSTPVVDLYDDMSCPHCADLEKSTGSSLLDAINGGKLVVNIRTMNFLDQGDTNGHSTKALGALYAIAKTGDATLYWNYRSSLFEKQSSIWGKWDNGDFAKAAENMGADSATVSAIKDATYHQDAIDEATSNEDKLKGEGDGTVSSPRVFVNGSELNLQALSANTFADWVPQAETGSAS